MAFTPVDGSLFFSRNDPNDPRLGDLAKGLPGLESAAQLKASLEELSRTVNPSSLFVLAGYPDDEGIRINGGRLGAMLAPTAVRKPLYKMTPSLLAESAGPTLVDLGDLNLQEQQLRQCPEDIELSKASPV